MNDPGNEESMLRSGLHSEGLSPEAMQRIRQAAHQEWRSVVAPRVRSGRRFIVAAAAAAVLAAGLGWAFMDSWWQGAPGALVGRVVVADVAGLAEVRSMRRDAMLAAGAEVREGQVLEARGDVMLDLAAGGNLRLARGSRVEVADPNTFRLRTGELYVDIPPGSHAQAALRIVTDAGEFHHLGTQFSVATSGGRTRLRVREGQVLWRTAAGDTHAGAGTELTIDPQGQVSWQDIATAGRDWAWVEAVVPEMDIEGHPLIDFLTWYARETGRRLDIDDKDRAIAAGISMHGNLHGLTLAEGLSAVMSTTSLKYELHDGAIRVSSASDSKAPPGR